MKTKMSLAPLVTDLLSCLSDHGGQHLTEVETDLIQTNILLNEAIEKLSASFMAIHQSVYAQQQLVNTLLADRGLAESATAELRANGMQVELHVNAAVTGLQFQDMTSQLISRTTRRVAGFRDALEAIGATGITIATDADNEQMSDILAKMNATLKLQSANLEKELWKAVCQTHMESGDIELF